MKQLTLVALILLCLTLSRFSFAHGWFEFTGARFFDNGKIGPSLAVGLHEPLLLGISYSSWNGVGVNVRENVWATTKHDLNFDLTDNVEFSFGVSLRHNDVNYSDVHMSLKTLLWE